MKEYLASSLYDSLSSLMVLIKNLDDENKRNLAMLFFSEAVRNIATIFNLLDLQNEKIENIVFNIKRLVDDE
jgi:hypothetical protein